MQVTPKRNNTIHYLPQEIRETRLTEVTYLPITREKEWVDVKWNPTITLPQLRSLVDMMNNMLLIPAKNKEFIMGKTMGKGYDSPQHTVSGVVYGGASVISECIEFVQDGVACRFQRTVRVFLYETTVIVISATILEF